MKSYQFKVTIFLLAFCVFQSEAMKIKPPQCRGEAITFTDKDMTVVADCIKEIVPNAKPDEDAEKIGKALSKENMACLGKCILTKEGLIDDKGMPSKEIMISKINASMPQGVVEDLDTAIEKCIDEQGKALDPEDKTCQSYQPLTQCMMVAFVEVCKIKKE